MRKSDGLILTIVDQLTELGLPCMATSFEASCRSKDFFKKDIVTLMSEIVDSEYQHKISQRYQGRLKKARLIGAPQDIGKCIDSKDRKYLPAGITKDLATLDFIKEGLNVCILGPSDSGKSYLARAIGIQACIDNRVGYFHCGEFLEEMVALKENDYPKYQRRMKYYSKIELVILDDFLLHTVSDEREIKVLFEIMEKRSELGVSTIVCSQREPKSWKSMILNDEVSSNAIMKRATKHFTVIIRPATK